MDMYRTLFLLIILGLLVVACKPAAKDEAMKLPPAPPVAAKVDTNTAPVLTKLWSTDAKLTTSESVFYDTIANMLYVSCINGVPPDKKDKDGFIAKVGLDGKIITQKWATGLSGPKGMGRIGNTLYVTDIDRLVAIDVNTGKISNSWKVAGATFLNDIATSKDGIVYFTDSNKSTIYQLLKGKVAVMLKDTSMHGTNGVFVAGKYLLIAGDGTTWSMDIANKSVRKIAQGIPAGDGIEGYRDGIFQSNWNGEVYYIDNKFKVTKVLDTKASKLNTADIWVSEHRNLLFVPTFFGNSVTAYSIKKAQ